MYKLDEIKLQKFFEEHGITQFDVTHVEQEKDDGEILIVMKPFQHNPLAEYLVKKKPKKLLFKSFTEKYKAERFIINYGGNCTKVYVLKKGEQVLDVFSFYELENSDKFMFNDILKLNIDEIVEED